MLFAISLSVFVFLCMIMFITNETVQKDKYTRLAQFIIDKGLFDEIDKELIKDNFKNYEY